MTSLLSPLSTKLLFLPGSENDGGPFPFFGRLCGRFWVQDALRGDMRADAMSERGETQDLVRRAKDGEPAALERLVERCQERVRLFLSSRAGFYLGCQKCGVDGSHARGKDHGFLTALQGGYGHL